MPKHTTYFLNVTKVLIFTVHEYETDRLLKKYVVNKDEPISFKNTPIVQEGGVYSDYREMEKTSKFLRKITSSDIGIAVYKKDDIHTITLGGKKEVRRGGMIA